MRFAWPERVDFSEDDFCDAGKILRRAEKGNSVFDRGRMTQAKFTFLKKSFGDVVRHMFILAEL